MWPGSGTYMIDQTFAKRMNALGFYGVNFVCEGIQAKASKKTIVGLWFSFHLFFFLFFFAPDSQMMKIYF